MAEAVVNIVPAGERPLDNTAPHVLGVDPSGNVVRREVSSITGETAVTEIQAGDGIDVDATNPASPIVTNTGVHTLVEGDGIDVDATDPQNPVITNTGVHTLVAGTNITIDDTDPQNPTINASGGGGGGFPAVTITGTADEIDVANGDGSGDPTISLPTVAKAYGKQSIPIPAGAMKARTTNGAATGTVEMTTNKNMFVTLDFDASTQEFAQFSIPMPKSWNEGIITFQAIWSHASTTTNFDVVWQLAAVAISNDDPGDVAFGSAVAVLDTGGTTNDIYITVESGNITVGGTPAESDFVMFQVARAPANVNDTMAIDARLHAIKLFITTNSGNDA